MSQNSKTTRSNTVTAIVTVVCALTGCNRDPVPYPISPSDLVVVDASARDLAMVDRTPTDTSVDDLGSVSDLMSNVDLEPTNEDEGKNPDLAQSLDLGLIIVIMSGVDFANSSDLMPPADDLAEVVDLGISPVDLVSSVDFAPIPDNSVSTDLATEDLTTGPIDLAVNEDLATGFDLITVPDLGPNCLGKFGRCAVNGYIETGPSGNIICSTDVGGSQSQVVLESCNDGIDDDCDGNIDNGCPSGPPLVWVLIHGEMPQDVSMIYVYDQNSKLVVTQFPAPPAVPSPHALMYDGNSLWVGGESFNIGNKIVELDPMTGMVRSSIPGGNGIKTQGLAVDIDGFWYASDDQRQLIHTSWDGKTTLGSHDVPSYGVVDMTADANYLYYVINDDIDQLIRVDVSTGIETTLAQHIVPTLAPYSLGFDGEYLVVADYGTLRRFDPTNGNLASATVIPIYGWTTAIAFEWHR